MIITIKWAPSSEFVSSSIPSWQILTAHAQPFRGARDLAFCLKVPLDSLLVWASSGGSGETARMRRLTWTFAARIGDKYQIRLTRSKWSLVFGQIGLGKQYGPSLIRVHTVCHSVCICWTYYFMIEPHCSNFKMITAICWVSEYLGLLQYHSRLQITGFQVQIQLWKKRFFPNRNTVEKDVESNWSIITILNRAIRLGLPRRLEVSK